MGARTRSFVPSRWHGRVKALQGNAGIGKRTDRGHVGLLVVGMVCRLTSDIRFYSFGSNIGVGPIDSAMLATYSLFLAVMDGLSKWSWGAVRYSD